MVLATLLDALVGLDLIDPQQIPHLLGELLKREQTGTSALGRGVALPHLRTRSVSRFVGAIGLAPNGVELGAIDGAPTRVVLLILAPFEERERHSELMGRLWSLFRDKTISLFLSGRHRPDELCDYLIELDNDTRPAGRGPVGAEAATKITPQ